MNANTADTVTLFGRQTVLDVLTEHPERVECLHILHRCRKDGLMKAILTAAGRHRIKVKRHSRHNLSRISGHQSQDQGVAIDIRLPHRLSLSTLPTASPSRLLALDGVQNPSNLGLIVRSVCAGHLDGLILPRQGSAGWHPLMYKASSGTALRTPMTECDTLPDALTDLQKRGYTISVLSSHADHSLHDPALTLPDRVVFVLGNESDGVSEPVLQLADQWFRIPMNHGVESLNVAMTATLLSFHPALWPH